MNFSQHWIAPEIDDLEFWEDFIKIYRKHPILWWKKYDENIDLLKKRDLRYQAIRELFDYCSIVKPELGRIREFVNVHVNKIYAAYMSEYKCVTHLKNMGVRYKPCLLFYDKLSFITCEEENDIEVLDEIHNEFLPKLRMKFGDTKVFTTVDLKTPAPSPHSAFTFKSILKKPNILKKKSRNIPIEIKTEEESIIKIEISDGDDDEDLDISCNNEAISCKNEAVRCNNEAVSCNNETVVKQEIVKEEPKLYSESYSDDDFVEIDFVDESFVIQEVKEEDELEKSIDERINDDFVEMVDVDESFVFQETEQLTQTLTEVKEENELEKLTNETINDDFVEIDSVDETNVFQETDHLKQKLAEPKKEDKLEKSIDERINDDFVEMDTVDESFVIQENEKLTQTLTEDKKEDEPKKSIDVEKDSVDKSLVLKKNEQLKQTLTENTEETLLKKFFDERINDFNERLIAAGKEKLHQSKVIQQSLLRFKKQYTAYKKKAIHLEKIVLPTEDKKETETTKQCTENKEKAIHVERVLFCVDKKKAELNKFFSSEKLYTKKEWTEKEKVLHVEERALPTEDKKKTETTKQCTENKEKAIHVDRVLFCVDKKKAELNKLFSSEKLYTRKQPNDYKVNIMHIDKRPLPTENKKQTELTKSISILGKQRTPIKSGVIILGKRSMAENEQTYVPHSQKKQCVDNNIIINNTNYSKLIKETNDFIEKLKTPETDPYAAKMAAELISLDPTQRTFVKKIIDNILVYAKLNMLNVKSRFLP